MAHYAKVRDHLVVEVIVAEADFFNTFVDSTAGEWIKTSYNTKGGKHYDPETLKEDLGTPLRKNFAGIGFTYDKSKDVFIPPNQYASWTLNEDTCQWTPPQPYPVDGEMYSWDEATLSWVEEV
jgi:hypothetical protein